MREVSEQELLGVSGGGGEDIDLAQLFEEIYQQIQETDCITCRSRQRSKCQRDLKNWLVAQLNNGNTKGLRCPQK